MGVLMYCVKCGAELTEDARFCVMCGAAAVSVGDDANAGEPGQGQAHRGQPHQAPLPSQAQPSQVQPNPVVPVVGTPSASSPKKGPSQAVAIAAAAVAVVVVVAVGVAVANPFGQGGAASQSASAAAKASPASAQSASAQSTGAQSASASSATASAAAATTIGQQPAASATSKSGDYVLADSSTRYYSRSEFASMDLHDLYLARNEIYARHGRGFKNADLQQFFNAKSWYTQRYTPEQFESMPSPLNDYERVNAELMLDVEKSRNSPYLG